MPSPQCGGPPPRPQGRGGGRGALPPQDIQALPGTILRVLTSPRRRGWVVGGNLPLTARRWANAGLQITSIFAGTLVHREPGTSRDPGTYPALTNAGQREGIIPAAWHGRPPGRDRDPLRCPAFKPPAAPPFGGLLNLGIYFPSSFSPFSLFSLFPLLFSLFFFFLFLFPVPHLGLSTAANSSQTLPGVGRAPGRGRDHPCYPALSERRVGAGIPPLPGAHPTPGNRGGHICCPALPNAG